MPTSTRNIVKDGSNQPIPQYYNPTTDVFEATQGSGGAPFMQLTGGYVESVVVASDTIAMSTTKYYAVDLIAVLGAGVTKWGVALSSTNTTGGKATVTVYSSPKNMATSSDPNVSTQNDIVATAQVLITQYPLQKQIGFIAPNVKIVVNSNGTIDLTGVKIVVWGIKGV